MLEAVDNLICLPAFWVTCGWPEAQTLWISVHGKRYQKSSGTFRNSGTIKSAHWSSDGEHYPECVITLGSRLR